MTRKFYKVPLFSYDLMAPRSLSALLSLALSGCYTPPAILTSFDPPPSGSHLHHIVTFDIPTSDIVLEACITDHEDPHRYLAITLLNAIPDTPGTVLERVQSSDAPYVLYADMDGDGTFEFASAFNMPPNHFLYRYLRRIRSFTQHVQHAPPFE